MPIKITNGTTSNIGGQIDKTEMDAMISDFRDNMGFKHKLSPYKLFFKFDEAFIKKDEMQKLVDQVPENGFISIHLALTKVDQKGCDNATDIGDMITFFLFAANEKMQDSRDVENLTLSIGFKQFIEVPPVGAPPTSSCCIQPSGGGKIAAPAP